MVTHNKVSIVKSNVVAKLDKVNGLGNDAKRNKALGFMANALGNWSKNQGLVWKASWQYVRLCG